MENQPTETIPDVAEDYQAVIWSSYINNNWELYWSSNPNAVGNPVRLTNNTSDDYSPKFNRTADKVVFVSNRAGNIDIYTISFQGFVTTRLTTHSAADFAPEWSPDGTKILFVSERDGNDEIYCMNVDGSHLQRVTNDYQDDFSPTWSSDNEHIAWVRAIDSTRGTIIIGAVDGGWNTATNPMKYLQHIDWSPTGTRFSFGADLNDDDMFDMAVINSDGSGLQVLEYGGADRDYYPNVWSEKERFLYGTELIYRYDYGQWYLAFIQATFYRFENAEFSVIPIPTYYEMDPNVILTDLESPTSYVLHLDPFTKMSSEGYDLHIYAEDQGGSLIDYTEVQYYDTPSSQWMSLGMTPNDIVHLPPSHFWLRKIMNLRSIAIDHAENLEPIPSTADTSTIFYHLYSQEGF